MNTGEGWEGIKRIEDAFMELLSEIFDASADGKIQKEVRGMSEYWLADELQRNQDNLHENTIGVLREIIEYLDS